MTSRVPSQPIARLVRRLERGAVDADLIMAAGRELLGDLFAAPEAAAAMIRVRRLVEVLIEFIAPSRAAFRALFRRRIRHPSRESHALQVGLYVAALGRQLELGHEYLRKVTEGAVLHDLGEVLLPPDMNPGTNREHARVGVGLMQAHGPLAEITGHAIGLHHERLDGTGFPLGLTGVDIPRPARLVAIADLFDELTTGPGALEPARALDRIGVEHSGAIDPALLRDFVVLLARGDDAW